MTAPEQKTLRLTRMRKAGLRLLSKRISLGEDGRPVSDNDLCRMSRGTATRVVLDWWSPASDLAELILELGSHEALVLGDHAGQDAEIEIGLKGCTEHSRSLETFAFRDGEPTAALLDFDTKGMPAGARAALEDHGGFEGALASLIPDYPGLAKVVRASTSAGLRNEETGETFPGSGGQHIYLFVQNGPDVPRFLKDLKKRAWLRGLGWTMPSARGSRLVRGIVDDTVGSPERLVFEGAPLLVAPLVQDPEARRPVAQEGDFLDTAACPPLTPEEERQCNELVEADWLTRQPEAEAGKEKAAEALATKRGINLDKARAVITASTEGELRSWDVLHFDDEAISEVSVADVLADPDRFHGETLSDPIEGRSYGRGKAKLYWNKNNEVICHSFAHGEGKYRLCHDPDYIELKVEEAEADAPYMLASLMPQAKLDPVERERLRNLAAKLGSVGLRTVDKTIKEAALESKKKALEAYKARGGAKGKGATKPDRDELVLLGGERPKQLHAVEAKLCIAANVAVGSVIMRGMAPAVIRSAVDPVKLRAGKQEIELPAGSAYLTVAKPEHLQAQLDHLFAFAKVTKEGEQYAVDCPADLAKYTLANANLLPLVFISRTPVLRSDGSVLDQPGYDPATAIFYAPEETFPPVPSEPTQEDAGAALERLRQPFRAFPFVTDVDRDAIVGEVLTLITRHLAPRAPAFVHNAIEPGTGKTKLFDTVAITALGTGAPLLNADILDDETELKKVLTTLTLAASPLVVFDNVARGGQITSPGLSNYLTATVYGDRLLGSNTEVKAATCTIIGMTGNAVEVVGDNTRRMFRIDLDAGVELPETREFDFDSEAEARRNRGELVAAALTILRAHALAGWPAVPGRAALGSFEDWDRLVAGAIVFAAGADIVALMDKTRTADPERDDLAEVLRMIEGVGAIDGNPMKTGEIIRAVEKKKTESANILSTDRPADEWHAMLCRISRDGSPNSHRIGRYLAQNAGRIASGLRLISDFDTDAKVNRYRVRRPSNERGTGFHGVYGVSDNRSISQEHSFKKHKNLCDEDVYLSRNGADQPPANPVTPVNPVTPAFQCGHCGEPIEPDSGFTALSSGEHLHNTCVDERSRR